ncbi:MAG TPA: NUDIX hydrolase [Pseudonocardiaceae bacterium]|nr:NUDIX hydrolase [Pseudonocardiaceae bacterium]
MAVRTVATWHEKPDLTPRTEMQQLLDTVHERASNSARARFAQLVSGGMPPPPVSADWPPGHALTVAIAIVRNEENVLVVQRRGEDGAGISWQFPAGVVKPGVPPEQVAVRETLAETGVHCRVVHNLGSRLHPITRVHCDYLLCDYLTGEPQNADPVENVSVTWAPTSRLTQFIPVEQIFPPILGALEIDSE